MTDVANILEVSNKEFVLTRELQYSSISFEDSATVTIPEETLVFLSEATQGLPGADGKTTNLMDSEYTSDPLAYYILAKA